MRDLLEMPGYHALFHLEPTWRASHQFNSRLHLSPADLRKVTVLIDRLEQELADRQAGFQFVATALFMEIVGSLSRCYSRNIQGNSQCLLRIAQAIAHLEVHYQDPMDLEYLAQIGRMSKRSLMRAFKKAMGMSPISYLIQVRMAKAVELLRQEELTITEIAHRVGYDDSNYFSRLFNTTMGLAPTAYRRRLFIEPSVVAEQRESGQLHNYYAAIPGQDH
jgi:AraC-like DNA-binding protein